MAAELGRHQRGHGDALGLSSAPSSRPGMQEAVM